MSSMHFAAEATIKLLVFFHKLKKQSIAVGMKSRTHAARRMLSRAAYKRPEEKIRRFVPHELRGISGINVLINQRSGGQ